ncbi:MAG: O-antigen ligase family protein [Chloroflexi bacterium]|nr:O-antigen ligase family protein [Chloroflexota bacterium]
MAVRLAHVWSDIWPVTIAVGLAVGAGMLAAGIGPAPAVGLALALPLAAGLLLDPRAGLLLTVVLVALLPYATLPVRLVLTPSLVTLAAAATIVVWLLRLLMRRDEAIRRTPLDLPLLLLLAASLVAFVIGLDRGYTTQTAHDFGKLTVGVVLAVVAVNTVRAGAAAALVGVLVGATTLSAGLGLALYAAGSATTEAALTRLLPLGYPTARIVRWIEDDPLKPMRLTSTGVDPNSFGGLLMVALVLAVGMVVTRRPLVPRWLTVPALPVLCLALLLTYSRGAWVGAAAGLGWLAVVRYRWLLPGLGLGGLAVVSAGVGAGFAGRLIEGLQLQDPATRLRLAEYQNALAIIQAYPVFGVGFGQAPSIDLQTGVSSIYLAVASRMGLVGLAALLWAIGAALLVVWRGARRVWATPVGDLLVALLAALVSALVVGVFDHYFFNIEFSHMGTLFWLLIGAAVGVATSLDDRLTADRAAARGDGGLAHVSATAASRQSRLRVP